MRNFRDLEVWKEALLLVKDIYTITAKLPEIEKFGLISQMNRCAVSIPSNIAEGCSKDSPLEFGRYLKISLGSSFELATQIEICILLGYLEAKEIEEINA
jgi:four helix bundle protein